MVLVIGSLKNIPQEAIEEYAKKHKLKPIDAYRELFSQAMLDRIDKAQDITSLKEVLREVVKQVIGDGTKSAV